MSSLQCVETSIRPPPGTAAPVWGQGGLLESLLREQQATAVEKFVQWHSQDEPPLQAHYYSDLIPLSLPASGEQYAFEVDLDACSGCKACVVACHNLNGLEEAETWRSVGLLHGGSSELPVLQHVTTACHHCLEPACLDGCPVNAYEKDPLTGIVRHLDDQCIGCQYCILKCPYDVPKYSHSKGIVRKCDMCSDRLAVGEPPACVQACPSQAIRVAIVSQAACAENAEANLFLPGAPEPGYTLPSTVYKSKRPFPANLLPADYYAAARQHAHWPLVLMLLFTQMSVGTFLVDQAVAELNSAVKAASMVHRVLTLGLGLLGLAAATLHLGRPWLAFRALIGWRTSWLSREVIAFGAFAALASVHATIPWSTLADPARLPMYERSVGTAVALSGLLGVFCSAMIYASTRRAYWNLAYTGLKFLLTCLVLGIPSALCILVGITAWSSSETTAPLARAVIAVLCQSLLACTAIKLLAEATILSWLGAKTFTPLRRTAILLTNDLARVTASRFACGALGGLALPGLLWAWSTSSVEPGGIGLALLLASMLGLNFAGELLERYLFFAAVVAPKMPGAPQT